MAHAVTSSLFYPVMPPGDVAILGQIDVVVAGADVLNGRQFVGLQIVVDPTTDTGVTLRNKIGNAVRDWASEFCPAEAGGVGVTIATNDILTGDFQKA